MQRIPALDWLNVFLADVRDGVGPFLAVYLLIDRQWDEASIGVVMTVMGLATLATQTPAGALIDATRAKRAAVAGAAIVVAAACIIMVLVPDFWVIAACKAAAGAAAAVFPPAIAAITLGITGPNGFARQIGRNEAFNHAGNAAAAILAGVAGWLIAPAAVFFLVAVFALASIAAVLAIPAQAIDHERARGLAPDRGGPDAPSGLRALVGCRPLLVFALCAALFHLANAAMLPMVGQKLALADPAHSTLLMSACIIAAQLVMVPIAILVGHRADQWGRKPIFLVAFAVLPLRGTLYLLSDQSWWLTAVQALDGVGAGIFGALFPLVVADLTRGTGRFNVSLGAVATAQGIGAALSTTVAGLIQVHFGYSASFLALAAIAAIACALFGLAMPETRTADTPSVSTIGTRIRAPAPAE